MQLDLLHPDEAVVSVIRTVFLRFAETSSSGVKYLVVRQR